MNWQFVSELLLPLSLRMALPSSFAVNTHALAVIGLPTFQTVLVRLLLNVQPATWSVAATFFMALSLLSKRQLAIDTVAF